MSAAVRLPLEPAGGRLGFLVEAIRSLTLREVLHFLLVGLVIAGINSTAALDALMMGKGDWKQIGAGIVAPLLVGPFVMIAWVVADRAGGNGVIRAVRLTFGVLTGSALATLCVPALTALIGLPLDAKLMIDNRVEPIPVWLMAASFALQVALYTGLAVATFEALRHRAQAERAVDEARSEHARLAHQVLESRLAAMQAQVEPAFLFDALVDVERLYQRDPDAAADILDRLIDYLRVALPRLRESGSTIGAEAELLRAYLVVVQALHGGAPRFEADIPTEAAARTFYPMLLLPLVQRAVRGAAPPASIRLSVHADDAGTVLRLVIARSGLCADDPELERVHERLRGLAGERARLACTESGAATAFTLHLPR